MDKYKTAKVDGNGVLLTVHSAAILGTVTQFAPLLGLTEDDIESMHSGLNVGPLVEWLQDNDWID